MSIPDILMLSYGVLGLGIHIGRWSVLRRIRLENALGGKP